MIKLKYPYFLAYSVKNSLKYSENSYNMPIKLNMFYFTFKKKN